jgi:hypothetical protein
LRPRWSSAAWTALLAGVVAVAAACGDREEAPRARTEPGTARDAGGDATPAGSQAGSGSAAEPGSGGDDEQVVAEVPGAITPWDAVVDRDRYLARRRQSGIVVGRLAGEAIAPGARGVVRWLVDETAGNGALAIRVAITGAVPADGTRLAVRGAWTLDSQRRWYWAGASMTTLKGPGPAPTTTDSPSPPGLVVTTSPPPSGYRVASRPRDGGVILFGVIRAPKRPADGWLVGDNSFSAPAAVLTLPGERDSYGGHDLRQGDERWQLKRGTLYWVRIDKVRKKPGDDRAWLRAVGAPVKFY